MEKLGKELQEIIEKCHKKGYPIAILVADRKKGEMLRLMDGKMRDVMGLLLAGHFEVESQTGVEVEDQLKDQLKVVEEWRKNNARD